MPTMPRTCLHSSKYERPRLLTLLALLLWTGVLPWTASSSTVDVRSVDLMSLSSSSLLSPPVLHDQHQQAHQTAEPPLFSCPNNAQQQEQHKKKADNDFDGYWTTYQEMNQENMKNIENFRDRTYDFRWMSYTEMKARTAAWKRDYFASVLESGNHIYESACGEALNLLQTLETLYECCNITNLTVHGNDYLADSIHVAHLIYNQESAATATTPWFHKGQLCQGDSTNLSHVPSNAFDLAYTGFIDPLLDPLHLMDDSATLEEKVDMIEEICDYADFDPQLQDLANQMQRRQEDWHAAWVSELIRITKPGKYVIIEDVGWPACSMITEWGGVDTDWWTTVAVDRYGWDVDVGSIEVVDEQEEYLWYPNRYNVRMRKNDVTSAALEVASSQATANNQ